MIKWQKNNGSKHKSLCLTCSNICHPVKWDSWCHFTAKRVQLLWRFPPCQVWHDVFTGSAATGNTASLDRLDQLPLSNHLCLNQDYLKTLLPGIRVNRARRCFYSWDEVIFKLISFYSSRRHSGFYSQPDISVSSSQNSRLRLNHIGMKII